MESLPMRVFVCGFCWKQRRNPCSQVCRLDRDNPDTLCFQTEVMADLDDSITCP